VTFNNMIYYFLRHKVSMRVALICNTHSLTSNAISSKHTSNRVRLKLNMTAE